MNHGYFFWHHLYYLVRFAFLGTLGFFARVAEVFLHVDFGHRYLQGRFGLVAVPAMSTVVLATGVLIHAPIQITEAVIDFEPKLHRTNVPGTDTDKRTLREKAREMLAATKDKYLLDEVVVHSTGTVGKLYRAAIRSMTLPFLLFVAIFTACYYIHVRHAEARGLSPEAEHIRADFHGTPLLDERVSCVDHDTTTRFLEPGLVVILALLCWGRLPGSSLDFPSFNADPVLGHFLLVTGVVLFLKEHVRHSGQRRLVENQQEQRKKADAFGNHQLPLDHQTEVVRIIATARSSPSVIEAYDGLPPHIKSLLTDIVPSNTEPGQTNKRPKESGSLRRIVCKQCGQSYRNVPLGIAAFRCKRCAKTVRIHGQATECKNG